VRCRAAGEFALATLGAERSSRAEGFTACSSEVDFVPCAPEVAREVETELSVCALFALGRDRTFAP
jgi:hypothetical protein